MTDEQLAYFQSLRDGTSMECCPDEAKLRAFDALLAEAERHRWIPVTERMPPSGKVVQATYTWAYNNGVRARDYVSAIWLAAKTYESDGASEIGEYDEATDTFYDPEGWYEVIENLDAYAYVRIHAGEVDRWREWDAP